MQQERRIDIEQLQLKFENGIFFKLSTSTSNARRTSGSLSNDSYCWCIIIWKNNKGKNMVHLASPYWYTDQPSVWYVLNHTDIPTHCTMRYTDKPVCTTHTSLPLDWYVPPIPGGLLWYNKPRRNFHIQ